MQKPLVSIYCLAYNHEKYIARALEGMVSQKTTFPFEIIVHDDASTDGTAQIIKDYVEKYPSIIRPIYQKENQYSKGVRIFRNIVFPMCKGKYLAVCEGDDYWTSDDKLQSQVDLMEKEPRCQMCTHACRNVVANTEEVLGENRALNHDGWLDPGLVIEDIQSPQTATFLFRASVVEESPDFFSDLSVGDYPRRVYCAVSGGVYYMNRVMSSYRKYADGAWTSRMVKNPEAYKRHLQRMLNFLEHLDEYTNRKFHESIKRKTGFYSFIMHIRFGKIRDGLMTEYFKELSAKRKIINFMMYKYPNFWYKVLVFRKKLSHK